MPVCHLRPLCLLLLAAWTGGALAQQSLEGRVILRWRADAEPLRGEPLATRAAPREVADLMQRRARSLAERSATPLQSGRALDARTQVLFAQGLDSASLARRLAMDPRVELVAVDRRRYASRLTNDPLYASASPIGGPAVGQWYLKPPGNGVASSINAQAAWDRTAGSAGVAVAVIDTGIRADHPDLAGNLLPGYDMIGAGGSDATRLAVANDGDLHDADPSDPGDWVDSSDLAVLGSDCGTSSSSWHGTRVAGLIAAVGDNGIGIAGAAFGSKIVPIRALGKCGGFDSDILASISWAVGINPPGVTVTNANPVKVINMSLGSTGACSGSTGTLYREAIATAHARGAVVVVAAGNSAGQPVDSPANCDGALAVVGLRHVGTKVGFSSMGPEVAIAAPGGNCVNLGGDCLYPMLSTGNSGTRGPGESIYRGTINDVGTSFATPLVAATAALMFSLDPLLTPAQLRTLLRSSARAFPSTGGGVSGEPEPISCPAPRSNVDVLECYCTTSTCGAGMMDAAAALDAVAAGLPALSVSVQAVPTSLTAGATVALSSTVTTSSGRSIASHQWSISAGAGLASFSGATNASSASLLTSGAGSVTVQLTVVDSSGASRSASSTITVTAAPTPAPAPAPAGGGGGGGSSSPAWLLALLLAALRLGPRR